MVSSVAVLVAGLAAFRRGKPADAGAKPGWVQRLVKGAGLVSTLWMAFNSIGRDQKINKLSH